MRSSLAFTAFAATLAAALPAPNPQDIDFGLVYAAPNPTYSIAVGATDQVVTYDTSAIVAAATQISTDTQETDDASNGLKKRTACAPQPSGATGAPTPSPDTASAFAQNSDFASLAVSAPTPSGYTQTFQNLNASNNAYGYLGFTTLQTYDSNSCASKCNAINGCLAFNVYFERDPSVEPGTGCTNPSSVTMIKCVFWGGPVNAGNANNYGQYRSAFQVLISGSNGYVNNTITAPAGYSDATYLGNAAIYATYDSQGYNTSMGSTIFTNGPFNAQLCADHCTAQSQYNLANPPTDGSPVQTCQFFNTYILYINNTKNLQGQYCALYSESWSSSKATNVGQTKGNDKFMIEYSYAFSNKTNPGNSANTKGAVYQASSDISLATAQGFCSTLLNISPVTVTATETLYTTPISTLTTASTAVVTQSSVTTPISTLTSYTTQVSIVTSVITPAASTVTSTRSITVQSVLYGKRAMSTPDVLTKYPAAIVSSACNLQLAQSPSATTTTITVTSTAPTSIATSLAVSSTTTTTISTADTSTILEINTASTTTTTLTTQPALTKTSTALATTTANKNLLLAAGFETNPQLYWSTPSGSTPGVFTSDTAYTGTSAFKCSAATCRIAQRISLPQGRTFVAGLWFRQTSPYANWQGSTVKISVGTDPTAAGTVLVNNFPITSNAAWNGVGTTTKTAAADYTWIWLDVSPVASGVVVYVDNVSLYFV